MQFILLLLLSLIIEGFFGLMVSSYLIVGASLCMLGFYVTGRSSFSKPIILLQISIALSIVSCAYYHGQPMLRTLLSCWPYLPIAVYFPLLKYNLPVKVLERLILWLFIIFGVCYVYQVAVYPRLIFISEDTMVNDESILSMRIRMVGMSLVGIAYFMSLSKVFQRKFIYLLPCCLALFLVVLSGFRTLSFMLAVFTVVFVLRSYKVSFKTGIFMGALVMVGILFLGTTLGQNFIEGMMEREESDQNFSNPDYIRYVTLWYYLQEHFSSVLEFFLGSGLPSYSTNCAYTNYYNNLEQNLGIHWYDWGILGLSWMTGFLSLVAMLWYSLKASFTRMPKEYIYLSVWFMYIFCSGFTSAEFVRQGNFYIQGIALYMIYKTALKNGKVKSGNSKQYAVASARRKGGRRGNAHTVVA